MGVSFSLSIKFNFPETHQKLTEGIEKPGEVHSGTKGVGEKKRDGIGVEKLGMGCGEKLQTLGA